MKKYIILFGVFLLFIVSVAFGETLEETNYYKVNDITGYTLVINDDASLLTENEIRQLTEDMYPLTEFGNIVFYSTTIPGYNTKQKANDYYYSLFHTDSGSVLLIDMSERMVFIYSDGDNLKSLNKSKSEIITDNMYSYLSKGEYYDGARIAFSQMNTTLNGGKIAEPMRHISNILVSLVLGFSVTFIYAFNNSQIASATNEELLKRVKKRFIINKVDVNKNGNSKVYSPISTRNDTYSGGSSYRSFSRTFSRTFCRTF